MKTIPLQQGGRLEREKGKGLIVCVREQGSVRLFSNRDRFELGSFGT
jgi:hypothetical protein